MKQLHYNPVHLFLYNNFLYNGHEENLLLNLAPVSAFGPVSDHLVMPSQVNMYKAIWDDIALCWMVSLPQLEHLLETSNIHKL